MSLIYWGFSYKNFINGANQWLNNLVLFSVCTSNKPPFRKTVRKLTPRLWKTARCRRQFIFCKNKLTLISSIHI